MDIKAFSLLESRNLGGWTDYRRKSQTIIDLQNSRFFNISLDGFDLSECDFSGSDFTNCSFARINMSNSDLRHCKFDNCNLKGADLTRCSFGSTYFYKCDLHSANFEDSTGLDTNDVASSFGDGYTVLPENVDPPTDWPDDELEVDEDELESENNYISVDNHNVKIPTIPERVVAPVETVWRGGVLTISTATGDSSFNQRVIRKLVEALASDLLSFGKELESTNVDRRISNQLTEIAAELQVNPEDFADKHIFYWFKIRPIFEYGRVTKGQHSDYIEARFISIEQNLRDILSGFSDWREYETASTKITITSNFDVELFVKHQKEFSAELKRQPDKIDTKVAEKIDDVINTQSKGNLWNNYKTIIFGAASSVANIISKVFQAAVSEIVSSLKESAKIALKGLVAATMASGGTALLWFLNVGLESFPWLRHAWEFIRRFYGL